MLGISTGFHCRSTADTARRGPRAGGTNSSGSTTFGRLSFLFLCRGRRALRFFPSPDIVLVFVIVSSLQFGRLTVEVLIIRAVLNFFGCAYRYLIGSQIRMYTSGGACTATCTTPYKLLDPSFPRHSSADYLIPRYLTIKPKTTSTLSTTSPATHHPPPWRLYSELRPCRSRHYEDPSSRAAFRDVSCRHNRRQDWAWLPHHSPGSPLHLLPTTHQHWLPLSRRLASSVS